MTIAWPPQSAHRSTVAELLLGQSAAMVYLRALIERVGSGTASVLITGPSGSGKERVAQAIHASGPRADKPFVAINCGAVPRELLESELFGHEKGAFTGAHVSRKGRFEEAEGGTLFLDEIGDMPPEMQVKLLRVLEERTVQRVGARGSVPIDIRLISATHRNLHESMDNQQFREDLYYRLAVFPIEVPGLDVRRDDIPLLMRRFLQNVSDRKSMPRFGQSAMQRLAAHNWPGNVRELRNFVERAAILYPGETIDREQVEGLIVRRRSATAEPAEMPTLPAAIGLGAGPVDLRKLVQGFERRYIDAAMARSGGIVSDAARMLGLQRTTLIEKLRRMQA